VTDLTFDDAVAYLDRHINLEKMVALAGRVEGLSLDRMRSLVSVLGDPQHAYPVVHLTGTNGKGSTARMVSALLAAHALTVGTYTSPHLESITERTTWDLEPIDRGEFGRVVGELAALEPLVLEELHGAEPSYFELLTAAAFAYFAEVAIDVAVVEVGMLGRYDATNVANADVAVLTNIGKDHTDGRGDWRRRIAEEKAGIIVSGCHAVVGEPDEELLPVFEAEGPSRMWVRDRDFGCTSSVVAVGGRLVDIRTPYGSYDQVFLPLHGVHQADNAACAVAAVEGLFGRALDGEIMRQALESVDLPGRCEVLHRGPLLVLDGAHNPNGAAELVRTLDEEFAVTGQRTWVLGFLTGRDVDEMLDALGVGQGEHGGDEVIACTPASPRGIPADELATYTTKRGIATAVVLDPVEAVLRAWYAASENPDDRIGGNAVVVTGSLYTVGDARQACRRLGLLE
jgi:dihydrofolate synthase / folylpolyglutamate synthase